MVDVMAGKETQPTYPKSKNPHFDSHSGCCSLVAMDKYLVPREPSSENLKPLRRRQWSRSFIELNGRFEPKYRHSVSDMLLKSYSQIGAFPHSYQINGVLCETHMSRITAGVYQGSMRKQGISALDFDNKGIYLVSVTKSGCLTVHDFENLYCQSYASFPCLGEEETKLVLHLPLCQELDCVRWNPANQDEVVCTSMKSNEVFVFDIGYISSKPSQVLRTRSSFYRNESSILKGLSDVAFTSVDNSRLFASDMCGVINVWDRRMSALPCLELATNSFSALNSIQSNMESQIIFGAGKHGVIYMWDLRGGRTPSAFRSHKEISHPPLTSLKLASLLEKIGPLKAQSDIVAKEIHSINLDPSCPYQLAFHLDDGWSGVLDLYNFQVTHIHCPPPAWLNDSNNSTDMLCLRKPSWLPTNSIYVVGSSSDDGIHLLDFYPDSSSPSHVNFNSSKNVRNLNGVNNQKKQNRFLPLSEGVTACAVHPLNGTIMAGTKLSSLLMISQSHQPC